MLPRRHDFEGYAQLCPAWWRRGDLSAMLGRRRRHTFTIPNNAIICLNHRDRDDGFTASFVRQMSNIIAVAVDLFATPDAGLRI